MVDPRLFDNIVPKFAAPRELKLSPSQMKALTEDADRKLDEDLRRRGINPPWRTSPSESDRRAGGTGATPRPITPVHPGKQLLELADNYIANNLPEKGKELLNKILKEHPGTEWAEQAKTRLEKLK
jgi:hypothetical protein